MVHETEIAGGPRYDVFLSHNQVDKPWVRELWTLLREAGLSVFFDAESIPPGANFVLAIGAALDASKCIVLILSEAALGSRWVTLETSAAIIEDPDGTKGKVLPVLLERIEPGRLPAALRVRNFFNLYDAQTRDAQLLRLLEHLHAAPGPGRQLPAWPVETLEVVDLETVSRWGWNAARLIRELMAMDGEVYGEDLPLSDETARVWEPLFYDHQESWRLIADGPNSIVAYWHCLPVLPQDFDELMAGRLTYGEFDASKVAILGVAESYDLYCAGICVRQRYRKHVVFKILFESLLDVLETLALKEILFQRIGANAFTHHGVSLCRSLGMKQGLNHPRHGTLYAESMLGLLESRTARRRTRLVEAYGRGGAPAAPP